MSQDVFVVPASFAQERLWFLDRLDPGTAALNLPISVRLEGELCAGGLRASLRALVRRHEALRTTFATAAGGAGPPSQVIHPERSLELPVVDLGALPGAASAAEAARLAEREAQRPFDLRRGPLLRASLLRQGRRTATLLVTMHHIVADGWSVGVLIRDVSALYVGAVTGTPAALPQLPCQYADWAYWQRERLAGEILGEQLGYWRQRLAGLPPGEPLAADHVRLGEAAGRHPAGSLFSTLPAGLADALRALARAERCTPFAVLLAAFMVLLHRLSGRQDIAVGSPVAGRSRSETRHLIGLFLNTLVLRADLSGQPSFRAVLARVRTAIAEALAHQDVPFEKLIEELRPERSRAPFFQAFFNMLSYPRGELALPGLRAEYLTARQREAKLDLEIYAEDHPRGIHFHWLFDAGRFDEARIDEVRCQYEELLRQAAQDPDLPVGALSLLTPRAAAVLPDARLPLADGWSGAVHEALARHAGRLSDKIAVSDATGAWTYGYLEARCNQLAQRLRAAGLGRGDLVAIRAHRSKELVLAMLGALQAGAAYTVLDTVYPAARQAVCLRLAPPRAWIALRSAGPVPPEVAAALADSPLLCRLELAPGKTLETGTLPATDTALQPPVTVGPGDAACVTFTSGSTGEPKGVLGCHGSLSHFLPWQGERFGFGAQDRFSMLAGLAHDPLQRDVFTPLWFGARLCIPDPERMGAPGWLAGWMAREEITVAHLSPATGRLLTDTAPADRRIAALRRAFFLGEALTWRDRDRLRHLAPRVTCVNLYGTTETQRAGSFYELPAGLGEGTDERAAPPLGRGIPDVQLLVRSASGMLAGIGEVGEIHVRSPHLARGYIGLPELTAERFLSSPWGDDPGDRIYRTGDLGRYLNDGSVEFLGRCDDQVQIRGFRVEPAEVQQALSRHPAVRQAAVIAWGDQLDERRLVAYVAAAEPPGPAAGELRTYLRRLLPEHMVPAAIVKLPSLPLLPNGKLDRRALPAPEALAAAVGEVFIAPRTPVEEILAALWCELLGIDRVGATDDFFDRGGHSLLVTRLVARLEEIFRLQVPLRLIFDAPNLAEQALRLEALRQSGTAREAPPLDPAARDGEVPLSFAQQRLWFLDQLEPGSPLYNLPAAVGLEGALSPEILRAALAEVVRRHEALRTVFAPGRHGAVQHVLARLEPALPTVDLGRLAPRAAEDLAQRLIAAEATRSFDVATGPLLRALLLRLRPERHIALVTMHHVVSDRWSMSIFFQEVATLYGAFAAGRPSPLPALPIQYADFALWQRRWLDERTLAPELTHWEQQLAGAPPALRWPDGAATRQRPGRRGGVEIASVDPRLRQSLDALARREASTLFMVLVAAFQVVLHQLTGQDDLVVGTDVANRTRAATEGLIGFFVNQLALRGDLSGDPPFAELLRRVRDVTLDAYAHQEVPFQKVVERLRPGRDSARSPLFEVKITLQNVPEPRALVPGLVLTPLEVERGTAQLDLIVNVSEAASGGLHVRCEYSADRFKPAAIRQLVRDYQRILDRVVREPSARLSSLCDDLAHAGREDLARLGRELEAASLSAMRSTGRRAVPAGGGSAP